LPRYDALSHLLHNSKHKVYNSRSSFQRKNCFFRLFPFPVIIFSSLFHVLLIQTFADVPVPDSFIFGESLLEFLSVSHQIPTITTAIDIMRWVPFDAEGCPRNRFFSLVENANLFPIKWIIPRHFLCTFLFTIHHLSPALDFFITRLLDSSFAFIIAVDYKFPNIRSHLLSQWGNVSTIFFLQPAIPIQWSSFSQILPPWMSVSAFKKSPMKSDWFSFHSGDDVPIRGRFVIKTFLERYRGHSEFFYVHGHHVQRSSNLFMKWAVCVSQKDLENANKELHRIFQNLSIFLKPYLLKGANWATISNELADYVLLVIRTEPELILRIAYSSYADEHFLQSIAYRLGVTPVKSCGHLRYIRWRQGAQHPYWLTKSDLYLARQSFTLFARKFPEQRMDLLKTLDFLIKDDKEIPVSLTNSNCLSESMKLLKHPHL
jgi:hypothetical protein